MNENLKKELISAGYTFLTVFIGVLLPHIDTLSMATLKDGTTFALAGAALRAALKSMFNVIILALNSYKPKQVEHE